MSAEVQPAEVSAEVQPAEVSAEARTHFLTVEETPRVKALRREWRKAAPFAAPVPVVMYPAPGAGRWRYEGERREAKWDGQGRWRPVITPARREWVPDGRTPQLRLRLSPEPGVVYHATPEALGIPEAAAELIRPGDSVVLDFKTKPKPKPNPKTAHRRKMPLNSDTRYGGIIRSGDWYTDGCCMTLGNVWEVDPAVEAGPDHAVSRGIPTALEIGPDAETVERVRTFANQIGQGRRPRVEAMYELTTASRSQCFSGAYLDSLLIEYKPDSLITTANGRLLLIKDGRPVALIMAYGGSAPEPDPEAEDLWPIRPRIKKLMPVPPQFIQ